MDNLKPFLELKTSSVRPFKQGKLTVTPEAQALVLRLPFMGFVWNRPVAVVVEQDGRRERYAILDVTRVVVLAMAVVGTAAAVSSLLAPLFVIKVRKSG